jgi:hypothetical protein
MENGLIGHLNKESLSLNLKASFRVLTADEKESVLNQPQYKETTADKLLPLSKKFHAYHIVLRDFSADGLSLSGDHPFVVGDRVEVSVQPQQYGIPVTMLVEAKATSSHTQLGNLVYTAGISILALDKDSLYRLNKYLLAEKIRQHQISLG